MKSSILTFIIVVLYVFSSFGQQKIQSPSEYFAHYGKQHSNHHQITDYIRYLDGASDDIKTIKYGETSQGRPLVLVFISQSENLKNLEDIRLTNLSNSGLTSERPAQINEKVIVWSSFGVHGNEAGTTESAINILFNLITDKQAAIWLKNTVVIIDPSVNPDGYDRYVHFLKNASGVNIHPGINAREHAEPWPSGRYNHYMFDMNRDLVWQTQEETRARVAIENNNSHRQHVFNICFFPFGH